MLFFSFVKVECSHLLFSKVRCDIFSDDPSCWVLILVLCFGVMSYFSTFWDYAVPWRLASACFASSLSLCFFFKALVFISFYIHFAITNFLIL